MITKDNITEILLSDTFKFIKKGNSYLRHYGLNDAGFVLAYDDKKKEFVYPEGVEFDRSTTMDSHQKESYVVFLCVAQLFARGYEPKHIKLEGKNFQLLDKGYCDILVRDGSKEKEEFLIIECKTADLSKKTDEFRKHWAKTIRNGDQLFRYFNTYRKAKYLCLFSCDYPAYTDGDTVKHRFENIYNVISLVDNEKILADPKAHSFEELRTKQGSSDEFFKVWKNTYHQDKNTRGIFESGIEAFSIGKKSYNIDDLNPVDEYMLGKKYNDFAVILRKHTVSSHENAFDKLVNLFLAKIVDETDNPDELKFQWKGAAYDDYFSLQDRLAVLYQEGMKRFFNDEVSYVEDQKIDDAFDFLTSKADVAREQIKKYFHELKYYNNNPFAFLDVHNEELFFQNATILTDVISMIQDIHLTEHNDNNQFLGDLFEGFLNRGVHQSEGQFFTPLPIVRFLVSSLPLERIISKGKRIPKVIDYACGAGHFLTEYARQIRSYVIDSLKEELATIQSETERKIIIRNRLNEHYKQIKGIEKDYRLSKVSQVAAYMYGMDGIEIHFADGLSDVPDIKDGSFDVLIANPPYSVSGFLETLPDDILEKYSLYDESLNVDKNKAIETFFIERSIQLLAPEGIASIILPKRVLTNDGLYLRSRELILKNFDIIAICSLGGGTFGQTDTGTITLFLRKKSADNNIAQHYQNRVEEWFKGNMADDDYYKDTYLLHDYVNVVGYNIDDYLQMLKGELTNSFLNEDRIKDYVKVLLGGKAPVLPIEAKKIREFYSAYTGGKGYKKDTLEKRENKKAQAILDFVRAMEKEKLYYFLLASSNPCNVLVMKSPENTKEDNKIEQRFLGYEWSDRNGNEGLIYLNVKNMKKAKIDDEDDDDTISQVKGINGIVTPLFNPLNKDDKHKINTLIRRNFNSELEEISEELSKYVNLYPLIELLDFKQIGFDKIIQTQPTQNLDIKSKFPLIKIKDVIQINMHSVDPSKITQKEYTYVDIDSVGKGTGIISFEKRIMGNNAPSRARRIAKGESLIISTVRPNLKGFAYLEEEKENTIYSTGFAILESADKKKCLTKYLYYLFMHSDIIMQQLIIKMPKGLYPSVNTNDIKNLLFPIAPLEIQKNIIEECTKIDLHYTQQLHVLKYNEDKIKESFLSVRLNSRGYSLSDLCKDIYAGGDKPQNFSKEKTDICSIPVYSNGTGDNALLGYTDKARTEEPCVTIAARGTLGYTILHEEPFFPIVRLIVAIPNQELVLPKYLKYALDEVEFINTGSATPQLTVPQVRKYRISVPSIEEQKKVIAKIEEYEAQIKEARSFIENSSAKKQKILDKYLK